MTGLSTRMRLKESEISAAEHEWVFEILAFEVKARLPQHGDIRALILESLARLSSEGPSRLDPHFSSPAVSYRCLPSPLRSRLSSTFP